ncbi:MAG TPA: metal ABC transporter substrate-binding protein [Nitrospira sp.]|jgi:zinc/manganese transport system substrate-binding protein/zinc transport system substrate-binding protein/manganese/iron transport system substrate-binding protein|nr:metal ABC transporter substrate-binding protein [Nitrospira sp.]
MLRRRLLALLTITVVSFHWNLCTTVSTAFAAEPLNVVVTLPVLKDWAQQIGGSHVHVTSLMTGYESEHTYSPKPSDLVAVRKAALLFEVGAGLEVWVSSLIKNAGNATLQVVTTSKGIELIQDRPALSDAVPSHQHEVGNPHMWLDPQAAASMIQHISEAMIQVDPLHATDYRGNTTVYLQALTRVHQESTARLKKVPSRAVVVHHPAWPYFARRYDLHIAGTILMQPGGEPSARHLHKLIETIKRDHIRVIVSEVQLNQKVPQLLAGETGARIAVLTTLPGGLPGTETYLDMLRYNVLQLAQAFESA